MSSTSAERLTTCHITLNPLQQLREAEKDKYLSHYILYFQSKVLDHSEHFVCYINTEQKYEGSMIIESSHTQVKRRLKEQWSDGVTSTETPLTSGYKSPP